MPYSFRSLTSRHNYLLPFTSFLMICTPKRAAILLYCAASDNFFLSAKILSWHRSILTRYQFSRTKRLRRQAYQPVLLEFFTSDSRQDMNFSTTCLRYSKFISLESFKSQLFVTVTAALGTSEFVFSRTSGTSLSGLIF